jgi:hypothetical protein
VEILVEKLPQCIVKKKWEVRLTHQKSGYFVSKDWGIIGIIPKDSRHVWMM